MCKIFCDFSPAKKSENIGALEKQAECEKISVTPPRPTTPQKFSRIWTSSSVLDKAVAQPKKKNHPPPQKKKKKENQDTGLKVEIFHLNKSSECTKHKRNKMAIEIPQ